MKAASLPSLSSDDGSTPEPIMTPPRLFRKRAESKFVKLSQD
jgi:hypothetical protein